MLPKPAERDGAGQQAADKRNDRREILVCVIDVRTPIAPPPGFRDFRLCLYSSESSAGGAGQMGCPNWDGSGTLNASPRNWNRILSVNREVFPHREVPDPGIRAADDAFARVSKRAGRRQ